MDAPGPLAEPAHAGTLPPLQPLHQPRCSTELVPWAGGMAPHAFSAPQQQGSGMGRAARCMQGWVPAPCTSLGKAWVLMRRSSHAEFQAGAWCCFFLQGLFWLRQDAQDPRRGADAALTPRLY